MHVQTNIHLGPSPSITSLTNTHLQTCDSEVNQLGLEGSPSCSGMREGLYDPFLYHETESEELGSELADKTQEAIMLKLLEKMIDKELGFITT